MSAPLRIVAQHDGTASFELVWPTHPRKRWASGDPVRGPIANQAWLWALAELPFTDIWFGGGISTGKTVTGCMMSSDHALTHANGTSMFGARHLPQIRKTQMRTMDVVSRENCEHNNWPGLYTENKQECALHWWNGHTTFYMGTGELESLRGPTLGFFWGDEIMSWADPYGAYKIIKERLREGGQQGRFLATGSFKGRRGPVMEWENRCTKELSPGIRVGTGQHSGWCIVTMSTMQNDANAENFASALEELLDPIEADRQLRGMLVDVEGRAFSDVWSDEWFPAGNVIKNWSFNRKVHELHVAIDWGDRYQHVLFIAHDPEAVSDYDKPTDIIFDELVTEDLAAPELIEHIARKCEAIGKRPTCFYPDPSGDAKEENQDLASEPRFRGITIKTYRASRFRRVKWGYYVTRARMKNAKGQRRLVVTSELTHSTWNRQPRMRGIRNCIINWDWERTRDGIAKSKLKDDSWWIHGIDALRYYLTHMYPTGYDRVRVEGG